MRAIPRMTVIGCIRMVAIHVIPMNAKDVLMVIIYRKVHVMNATLRFRIAISAILSHAMDVRLDIIWRMVNVCHVPILIRTVTCAIHLSVNDVQMVTG